ncbi:START domain-containing protein [Mucilaginibacter sp. L3T2-6]|uniref:START domain-containing protein n=1 Tax=Mucilaginibacter sp. L3T2-6 TaxID=3062491 RepID=UPI002675F83D|nr:START domain-containing protein [Mucilaginibacter sp. L3T2-6]MDO3644641.1 START domain-containing protein [Mucilaginibacter sp. L3T2-6]MDV6217093.1 START domain-containing protein [Mucilaginibacter sp. L3T2-6]
MLKVLAALFITAQTTVASAQTGWKLKNEKDGIKVYVGAVPDSKFKAIRVDCELNTTLSQLVKVLLDIKTCPEWVDHTKSCTLLKQVSPSELYYYSEINIPWPAQNRDFVAHLTVRQNPNTKVVTMDGPAVDGFVPEKEGIVRVHSSKGLWILTPVRKDVVRVVYTLQTDPGGDIPAWLVNLLAASGPMKSFQALKLQLKKPAYQHVQLDFIKD